jgi:transcription antitermination factor NusG
VESTDEWVVLHCYAGYEGDVMARIRRGVPDADLRRLRRDGVEVPGCLLWRWEESSWDAVRNAGGVTGFVGTRGEPERLPASEVEDT